MAGRGSRVTGTRRAHGRSSSAREQLGTGYRIALTGIAAGIVVSVSALVLGLVLLARARPATVVNAQGTAAAADPLSSPAESKTDSPGPRTTIDIDVRHLGNLKLEIKAAVMNERSRLSRANVVAYADMKEMPLAHLQGPLPMREARGRPGVYTARAGVPMVGDYEIRVEVRSPIRADETKLVSVGVVGSAND